MSSRVPIPRLAKRILFFLGMSSKIVPLMFLGRMIMKTKVHLEAWEETQGEISKQS